MAKEKTGEYDVIVVGSGPGGATVGREMARAGKRVLILESGGDDQRLGSYLTAFRVLSMDRSKEGLPMLRARTTGGASVFFSASAADPPPWLAPRYGIDLFPFVDEIKRETKAGILPERLLGKASIKVMETANRIGYHWEPMAKFLDPEKFDKNCCGANTHLGCRCGAKWTAREFLKDAVAAGAKLLIRTECEEVIVEDGVAAGVRARTAGGQIKEFRAPLVVLSAGGLGTPLLLQKAGIDRAGAGCYMDPTVLVYGLAPFEGNWQDPPVSVVTWEFYDKEGIRVGAIMEPKWMLALNLLKKSPRHVNFAMNYRNVVGILVKVKDDLSGRVHRDGSVSKKLAEQDWDRINRGVVVAKNILRALECRQDNIVVGEAKGAHPSGTCRIGDVLDKNLQSEIKNLYACDASIFPEALDRPTVLTIVAFGKRLSRHLLSQ